MAKIITSYLTTDEVELEFDTEYRFIENEKYNKENDEEIINLSTEYSSELISKSKNQNSHIKLKRFGLRNALLLGSFGLGFLMPCACSHKEETEIVVESEETVNLENTTDEITTIVEENTEPEVSVEPEIVVEPETVVEPVEEVNSRDMKAVYGLDFDVPIYTEEEVEQAKYNLQHNYADYNGYFEEGYSEEQILAIKDDYYIANQDFWYQLYNMTKDFKCKTAYVDGKGIYYLEDKDWYIEVRKKSIRIYGDIYGSGFAFTNGLDPKGNEADVPNNMRGIGELSVGPGAYVLIADKEYYAIMQGFFEERGEIFDSAKDLKELEHYGFHNNELTTEYVGYLNGKSLSLE